MKTKTLKATRTRAVELARLVQNKNAGSCNEPALPTPLGSVSNIPQSSVTLNTYQR